MTILLTSILCFPLLGAAFAGLLGSRVNQKWINCITIGGIAISFWASACVFKEIVLDAVPVYKSLFYIWGIGGYFSFNIGFLVDRLTAVMLVTVTFVSLLVHIYSIGYMKGDSGYARFFSYMSLFTFFMLVLVSADNFLLLFFGWEGVGLVSYLLIGFWFPKESAAVGSFKAFIVNRVGDFGFVLGISGLYAYFGTLDYATVFQKAPALVHTTIQLFPGFSVSLMTLICILLFIGAMAKSAQVPLHVWLPESMEGPTPISALIHAATMVTAGVYMIARLSPLFELSQTALSMVLVLGATGALFLGLVGLVQTDIKRVIAYSTLSQLGYMMAANGVGDFSASIFHLMTHAAFKALLFLAAGSVILAMHHEQDMRKMGGLRKYMPITYITFLIGSLALAAIPPFSGFYSKDAIIEMVQVAQVPGAQYAYICLLLGTFVTALYIFRAFFMTFHGKPRFDLHDAHPIKESPFTVTMPLILLAIPSVVLGFVLVDSMLYSDHPLLGNSVFMLSRLAGEQHNAINIFLTSVYRLPFWFAIGGILTAWIGYIWFPRLPTWLAQKGFVLYLILVGKYGFDKFNDWVFVRGVRKASNFFFIVADSKWIDDFLVNGSGRGISYLSTQIRKLQSGYIYHYALVMILGLLGFLTWLMVF